MIYLLTLIVTPVFPATILFLALSSYFFIFSLFVLPVLAFGYSGLYAALIVFFSIWVGNENESWSSLSILSIPIVFLIISSFLTFVIWIIDVQIIYKLPSLKEKRLNKKIIPIIRTSNITDERTVSDYIEPVDFPNTPERISKESYGSSNNIEDKRLTRISKNGLVLFEDDKQTNSEVKVNNLVHSLDKYENIENVYEKSNRISLLDKVKEDDFQVSISFALSDVETIKEIASRYGFTLLQVENLIRKMNEKFPLGIVPEYEIIRYLDMAILDVEVLKNLISYFDSSNSGHLRLVDFIKGMLVYRYGTIDEILSTSLHLVGFDENILFTIQNLSKFIQYFVKEIEGKSLVAQESLKLASEIINKYGNNGTLSFSNLKVAFSEDYSDLSKNFIQVAKGLI